MTDSLTYGMFLTGAYLLGSVPFGLLIGRAKGIDIRTAGSGNVGATNVWRLLGKKWGITTFILDFVKGFTPAAAYGIWLHRPGQDPIFIFLAGFAAVLGHMLSVFLKFKGGKGVATSAGVLTAAAPLSVACGLAAWGLLFAATRIVSLASIAAAAVVAVSAWFLYADVSSALPLVITALAGMIIFKHKANIQRLLRGTEGSFKK